MFLFVNNYHMKKIILLFVLLVPMLLAWCTYQERVCDTTVETCKVIAVEPSIEWISKLEEEFSFWLAKKVTSTREVVIECSESWRHRTEDDTHIVWDTYNETITSNCRLEEREM